MKKLSPLAGMRFDNKASENLKSTVYPLCIGLIGLMLGFLSLAFVILTYGRSQFVPYIVTVDNNGSILNVGTLEESHEISDEMIAAFACDFLEHIYTFSSDKSLQQSFITKAYASILLRSSAKDFLDAHYQSKDYMQSDSNETVKTYVSSLVRLSKDSYQADFSTKTIKGDEVVTDNYKALLSLKQLPLVHKDLNLLRLNPLGLFIYEITVSKRYEALES